MKQNQESREEEKKKQKGNQTDASRDGWKKGVSAEVSRPPLIACLFGVFMYRRRID
jgi:hypothetical protein